MNSDDNNSHEEKDIEYAPEAGEGSAIDKKGKNVNNTDSEIVAEEETGAEVLKKLRQRLALCVKEKQDYLDKWQRSAAEFQNARKRDATDNERFRKYAAESLIAELLPVLESFNAAFGNKEEWEKVDKHWRTGVEYIASQLKGVLEANGLKELNPLGEKFDPALHEAAEFVPATNESENHKIIAVIHKGYAFYDRVLRAPKVRVGEFKG
ncbi:MAG: nucleotide exchange factor GrpE [Candidatus Taylorbacteria bacterium]|nr:nucleotide exchange factor GrpE [Candidatus Taylorbacteria bacterium]